jgi:CBS domain-containing protein
VAKVRDIMNKHIVAVSKITSVGTAIQLMKRSRVSVVPVLDGKVLFGVLTMDEAERQIERWGDERNVGSMRLRLLFAEADDKPESAARLMVAHRLNRLPVVDSASSMHCIGIISSTEIARRHKKKIF